jgi:hypothetical protein
MEQTMPKADSHNIMNPSPRRAGASIAARQSHSGALKALARLREETIRQVTKLTGKGYRKVLDCNVDKAAQSSGLPRSRRQAMVLMSSAAVLAIGQRPASATVADATSALPAAPGASDQLQALINRYLEKKSTYRNLERREDELEKIELQMMPDPPPALCRRKADARLFRDVHYRLREPSVELGEPYTRGEVKLFAERGMMRNREIGKIDTPEFRMVREPWPLAKARADAIVAAQNQWDDDCEILRQRLGLTELVDAMGEAYDAMRQVQDEIENFEVSSLADVKLKARFAVVHLYEGECEESGDLFAYNMLRQLAGRMGKGTSPELAESGATCDA